MWIGIRESGKRRNINVNATGLEKARMRIAGREGSFKKARRKETKTLRLALGCWHTGIRPSGKPRGSRLKIRNLPIWATSWLRSMEANRNFYGHIIRRQWAASNRRFIY